jgi:cytochrome c oxidase cbb3-type subunit 3
MRSTWFIILLLLTGCKREIRIAKIDSSAFATVDLPPTNTVWPGPTSNEIVTNFSYTNVTITNWSSKKANPTAAHRALEDFYEKNGWSMSEGKRLFAAFNCVGCHGHGGGGMGPALMDTKWIYGNSPEEIFQSIALGRANGMPAFKDRIPEYMVWEMVAYVRSMSGLAPVDAAPQRDDHLQTRLPENTIGAVQPGGKP